MISRIIVGTLSICLFLAALVAMTPLPFILKLGKVDATGLTWSNAYGTLFDGGLDDVSFGPQRVGDVTLKMRPGALLGGRLQYSFDVSDGVGDVVVVAITGEGVIGAMVGATLLLLLSDELPPPKTNTNVMTTAATQMTNRTSTAKNR